MHHVQIHLDDKLHSPLESFAEAEPEEWVRELRSTSRILR